MKTKPGSGAGGMSVGGSTMGAATPGCGGSAGSSRSHSKRGSREDKLKLSGESGGSSQCDTPPLTEKEWSVGKVAGIGAESVLCAAEQLGLGAGGAAEVGAEAAAALAEDVSFKLRQLIHSVWVRSQLARCSRVSASDVDSVLKLMDTEPVLGPAAPNWLTLQPLGEYCYEPDTAVYPRDEAVSQEPYTPAGAPALTVRWVCDERSAPSAAGDSVHPALRSYCMHVSKALLKGSKKMKAVVLSDLATNTRIGPILPNLLNLAVLVLNDDNLNTLHVPVKEPLKRVILEMIEALCANPCSLDTDVLKQLQRLYPALVTDILKGGVLTHQMIGAMTKIASTWPAFLHIGEKTLYSYLVGSESESSRVVCGAVVRCLSALGRRALRSCLEPHLQYVDGRIHAPPDAAPHVDGVDLAGAVLDASSVLLRPDADCWLEDHVAIDETLYEMLGDSLLPRRLSKITSEKSRQDCKPDDQHQDDDILYLGVSVRPMTSRSSIRILPPHHRQTKQTIDKVFEPSTFRFPRITISIKGARCRHVTPKFRERYDDAYRSNRSMVVASCGRLLRYRYKMRDMPRCPVFAGYIL